VHHDLASSIIARKPASVLDLGGARGYIAKILQNNGIKVSVMDRSEHCYNTRAVDDFCVWDIENTPYPFEDKAFDLVYSNAVLEHISPGKIDSVIREIGRIGNRSYHNNVPISDEISKSTFKEDITHKIYKSHKWWISRFAKFAPGHSTEVFWETNKKENCVLPPMFGRVRKDNKKLNIGCGIDMIYYGWINIDVYHPLYGFVAKTHSYAYMPEKYVSGLPFADNDVDLIFVSGVFGQTEPAITDKLVSDCYRVLKPGGTIRVSSINAKKIFAHYVDGTDAGLRHIIRGVESPDTTMEDVMRMYAGHQHLWDSENMMSFLGEFGFTEVAETTPFNSRNKIMEQETIVKYPGISLVMEGIKGDN
jgi:SAM-dependent methyltransferase